LGPAKNKKQKKGEQLYFFDLLFDVCASGIRRDILQTLQALVPCPLKKIPQPTLQNPIWGFYFFVKKAVSRNSDYRHFKI